MAKTTDGEDVPPFDDVELALLAHDLELMRNNDCNHTASRFDLVGERTSTTTGARGLKGGGAGCLSRSLPKVRVILHSDSSREMTCSPHRPVVTS